MPAGNAIELFNCSICSFCETSLDRLSTHIRQHIKPEPTEALSVTPSPKDNIVTPRVDQNGILEASQKQLNGVGSTIGNIARSTVREELLSSNLQNDYKQLSSEEISHSPRIEIVNSRTLSSTNVNNYINAAQPGTSNRNLSDPLENIPPPPPLVEKSPQATPYGRGYMSQQISPRYNNNAFVPHNRFGNIQQQQDQNVEQQRQEQIQNKHENSQSFHQNRFDNFQPNPNDQQNHPPRYASIQPRDHQQIQPKTHRAYQYQQKQYQQGYINGTGRAYPTEYIPVTPVPENSINRDIQPMHVDTRATNETLRRNAPQQDRAVHLKKHVNVAPHSTQRVHQNENRHRLNQHYDMQQFSHPTRVRSADGVFQGNIALNQLPSHKARQARYHQPPPPPPPPPPSNNRENRDDFDRMQYQYRTHIDHISPDGNRYPITPQMQSRLNTIQYNEVKKQPTNNPIGIPNKGTVILNPDQLLSATGNVSLDQLAGLLIVPLKKTVEMSTQTDPIQFVDQKYKRYQTENQNNMAAQTDLKMMQINENITRKSPSPVFDQFRSTDALFECLVCGHELASDHHLQEHISQNHTHVCEKCYHTSTNLNEHNTHVLECGQLSAEMLCMECNSSFTSLKKFNQHRSKAHNVRMPFRCGICNVPFETHDAVMKHISTHDSDLPEYKCRHCVKVFQSSEALSKHLSRHKMVEVLHECRFCMKTFGKASLLQDHISYLHVINESIDMIGDTEIDYTKPSQAKAKNAPRNDNHLNEKRQPICKHCDLAFKNNELLRRHIDVCSKNRDAKASAFICDVCKEYFPSDLHRKQHLKQDHRRPNGYRCPKCSKIYRTWSRLKFHTKQQHLKRTCTDCNLVFTKEHVLRKHQEDIHGKPQGQPGERVYTCSLCNTMLHTLTDLMNHRRDIHPELSAVRTADEQSSATMLSVIDNVAEENDDTALSVSKCPECSEIFTSGKLLNEHIKMKHGSTKNRFPCEQCEMSFDDEKRLKNHLGLIHGERPFECEVCDKKFQYSSQVIWHMRCHKDRNSTTKSSRPAAGLWKAKTGKFSSQKKQNTSFICQFCGAKFKREKLLKNHKGSVHKIKLFPCEICDVKFGHSTELIWHLRVCRAKFQRMNPGIDLPVAAKQAESSDDGDKDFDSINDDFAPTMTSANFNSNRNNQIDNSQETSSTYPSNDNEKLKSPNSSHLQLSNADAEELLKNEPQFDSNIGEYSCPICQKTTRSVTGMKTHYGRCHGVWSKETSHKQHEEREVTIYPCKYCDHEYQNFKELQTHCTFEHAVSINIEDVDIERRHEFVDAEVRIPIVYTCPHCHISFDNSKAIRVHAFKKHGILLDDEELSEWRKDKDGNTVNVAGTNAAAQEFGEDELRYKCQRCKSKFRTTKSIRIHTFKRHGFILSKKELARCKQWVPTTSLNEPPINRNKGRDLVDEPNPCDKCGRVFGNYRALFTHYRQAHRITNENFVPRKPSRTELTANFMSPEKQELVEGSTATPKSEHDLIPPTENTASSANSTVESVACPKCDREFTAHKSLIAHLYSAHKLTKDRYEAFWPDGMPNLPRVSEQCPTCNKECVDRRAMRIHMYKAHGVHFRDYEQAELLGNENPEDDTSTIDTVEPLIHDETKLSIDVDVHGPPVCFICDRLFKGRRALMTHEHKYHGIRWVNLKRIFPDKVRNLPSSDSFTREKQYDNSMINTPPTVGFNNTSTLSNGFTCPQCNARYHNRRAITTHLCRIHRYKRDDIHAYFGNLQQQATTAQNDETVQRLIEGDSDNLVIDETMNDEKVEQKTAGDVDSAIDTNTDNIELMDIDQTKSSEPETNDPVNHVTPIPLKQNTIDHETKMMNGTTNNKIEDTNKTNLPVKIDIQHGLKNVFPVVESDENLPNNTQSSEANITANNHKALVTLGTKV